MAEGLPRLGVNTLPVARPCEGRVKIAAGRGTAADRRYKS